MGDLAILGDRLRNTIKRVGLEPLALFEEYQERGFPGYLSQDQFRRALASIKFWMKETEFRLICDNYLEPHGINYQKLCKDISPDGQLTTSLLTQTKQVSPRDLIALGSNLKTQGINLYDIFFEFDKVHFGRVPLQTFFRGVGNNQITQRIAKGYLSPINEVDYFQLQKDMDAAIVQGVERHVFTPSELPPFFTNLAQIISSRNLNIYEECLNSDHLQQGKLLKPIFLSVLSSFHLNLGPSQLQQIANFFSDGDYVNYRVFLQAVDDIQKFVTATAPAAKETTTLKEEIPIEEVLKSIRAFIANRRMQIDMIISKIDPEQKGTVPHSLFYRSLALEGFRFSNSEINSLDSAFANENTFNTAAFLEALYPKVMKEDDGGKEVLSRLKSYLETKKIRISRYFASFDLENSGIISIKQLLSVFHQINFELSKSEVSQIIQKYRSQTSNSNQYFVENIDYKSLCDDVETPLPKIDSYALALQNSKRIHQTGQPNQVVVDLIKGFQAVSSSHNVDLRNLFAQRDTNGLGTISISDFKDVLRSLRIRTETIQFATMVEFYRSVGGDINYNDLCNEIDKIANQIQKEIEFEKLNTEPPVPKSLQGMSPQLIEALSILKTALQNRRVDVSELFEDVDHTRTGLVQISLVRPILITGIKSLKCLQEDQMQLIQNYFKSDRQEEKFNYKRLCTALNELTLSEQELAQRRNEIREEDSQQEMLSLLNEIRNKLDGRRRKVLNLFSGIRTPYINEEDFKEALESSFISVSEQDYQKIFRRYKKPEGIIWRQFCTEVERTRVLLFNLNESL